MVLKGFGCVLVKVFGGGQQGLKAALDGFGGESL